MPKVASFLVSLLALASTSGAAGDGITVRTLGNGLRVVVKEDHGKPLAALRIYVRTGGALEMEYLGCGISHYCEHLVSGGTTTTRREAESSRILQELGGQKNAYTAFDHTCYHILTHRDFIGRAIDLYGDWMVNCTLDPAEVEREKGVILREINMGEDEPRRVLGKLLNETMYREAPLRVPNIGYRENFARLTRDDVVRYHRNRYAPDNAVVAVAGDVDPEAIFAAVEASMGGWERRPLPVVTLKTEPRQTAPRYASKEHDVKQAVVHMAWPTIDLFNEDLYDLDMISAILSEGKSSRLCRRMVEVEGLTDAVDTWSLTPWYMAGGFGVSFQVPVEALDRAIEVVKEEVRRIGEEPGTPAEIERAKTLLVCRHALGLQRVEDLAAAVGIDLLTTGDARFSSRYMDRIREYGPERMASVAKRWLRDDGLTIAVLRPRGSTAAGAGRGPDGEREASTVREETLANGLKLVVRRLPGIVPVGMEVFLNGGLRAEPAEKNGVSNLTARLLLRGTRTRTAEEITSALEAVGGSVSSQSGNHTIGLSLTLPRGSGDLPVAAEILGDILSAASFPTEEFDREHRLASMLSARQNDAWQSEAFHFLRREAYGDGPYGRPATGTPESLATVTREDVLAFARRWVDPRGMVACVAGDVDPEVVVEVMRKALGGLAGRGEYAPPSPAAPAWAGGGFSADRFAFRANTRGQAVLTVTFAAPAWGEVADRAALTVIDAFTSGLGLPSGWLHEALRGSEQSLVYFVHLSVFAGMEGGLVYVMTQTQPDLLAKVHDLVMAEIGRLRRGEYTDVEIAVGKAMAMVSAPTGLQTVNDIAQTAALGELFGSGYDFEQRFQEAVKAVTRADIERVVGRYFGHGLVCVTGSPEVEKASEAIRAQGDVRR